jgi:hydroxymethylpyrimidine/phosphomethylpyrimidine kinase
MRIALTIAGSDSGGGAGIQADLKTFQRFGVFGTSAITAITAQNTRGVSRWEAVSPDLVRAQIDTVVEDLPPTALKSGMLANAAVASAVASAIREHSLHNYVLDPVMVATSGDALFESDTIEVIRRELIPQALLVTPNLLEAAILVGDEIGDEDAMARAAEKIVNEMGAQAALIKGGHLASGDRVVDLLYDGNVRAFRAPRLDTRNTHGTGCTLSAAIAAQLANGESLHAAVRRAIDYVHNAIATAPGLGSGHGPLNHLAEDS